MTASVAEQVITGDGLSYVPYQRTWRGLPVVGGDFVVVTDAEGHVLATSVAQTSQTRLASTTPALRPRARAASVARQQLDRDRTPAPRLVVWQGKRSTWPGRPWAAGRDAWAPLGPVGLRRRPLGPLPGQQGTRRRRHRKHGLQRHGELPDDPHRLDVLPAQPARPVSDRLDYDTGAVFSGPDDVWGNGNAEDRETACTDAPYAVDQERRMLAAWLGRNGMDGFGGWVPIRVGLARHHSYSRGHLVVIGRTKRGRGMGRHRRRGP